MRSLTARLAPTPFWDLTRDRHQWLIFRDRTYLISNPLAEEAGATPRDLPQLCISGKIYALEECESIGFLEARYLSQHSKLLEELIKNGQENRTHSEKEGSTYWQHLAMLANEELIRKYSAGQRRTTNKNEAPVLQDNAVDCLLENYVIESGRRLRRSYALWDSECIEFKRTTKAEALTKDTWLSHKGQWYSISGSSEKASLEKRLKGSIAKTVKRMLDEGISWKQDKDALSSKRPGQVKRKKQAKQQIKVSRISENSVHFRKILEPFIIKHGENYYAFPEIKLDLEVRLTKKGISIPGAARVTSRYRHPFVNSSREICHGKDKRFSRLGIKFSRTYQAKEHDAIAFTIATLLDEAAKVLHLGYQKDVRPFHKLTQADFRKELCSKEEAEASGWKIYRQ